MMMAALGASIVARFRAVGVGVLLAIGGLVAATLFQVPLAIAIATTSVETDGPVGFLLTTLLQSVGFIVIIVFYTRSRGFFEFLQVRWPSLSDRRQLLRDLSWGVGGAIVLFALSQLVGFILQNFGMAPGTNVAERVGRETPAVLIVLAVLSFLAIGPGEEILFRGGIQGRLRESFSPVSAIFGSSILFGLIHTTAVVGTTGTGGIVGYVITAFLLGTILGSLYEYTSNLLVPIFVHGGYNALLFLIIYVSIFL